MYCLPAKWLIWPLLNAVLAFPPITREVTLKVDASKMKVTTVVALAILSQ